MVLSAPHLCLAGIPEELRSKPRENNFLTVSNVIEPAYCLARHDIGKISMAVANNGMVDSAAVDQIGWHNYCYRGVHGSHWSTTSQDWYNHWGAFWIGAVVGRDTLVSTGYDGWGFNSNEFSPDEAPFGFIEHRSIIDPLEPEFEGAISEQDYIARYTDTVLLPQMFDPNDNRLHIPLGIEVIQKSYAWSYAYAEDFVLFDYSIKNVGQQILKNLYLGIYVDGDARSYYMGSGGPTATYAGDDILGFLPEYETSYGGCDWVDTTFLAWFADNDADFHLESDIIVPQTGIAGVRLVRTPSDSLQLSFNWWSSNTDASLDYGPQTVSKYRYLSHGGSGTPEGDKAKYHYLSNQEFDFDQIYTKSIVPGQTEWTFPNQVVAETVSRGGDSRYLLSFGPFYMVPGQELPISFAYLMGDDFHRDPTNAPNNLTGLTYHPREFMRNVHFDDIVKNAMWASWVYDNPGVDTDGDGYFGKFRLCCTDTSVIYVDSSGDRWDTTWSYGDCREVFYEGDGVPDFRGASPPPAPKMWLEPIVGEIRVRWNGTYSENTPDIFTRTIDFEGYRVHLSLDARESSYTLLASYDKENFDKLVWDAPRREWAINDTPFTARGLACFYGDSCEANFNPLEYSKSNPYFMPGFPDSIFSFASHEYNMSELGRTTAIRKVYPYEPYPSTLILDDADPTALTEEGYLKYFEYEYLIKDILPTIQYYVSVTVFDYGAPQSGLDALETSKTLNAQRVYAMPSVAEVERNGLAVYTYPNPYLINADYRAKGFEGREARWFIPERDRRIHFVNLPAKCTIGIYSLDGDMIREIEHDRDPSAADASHDEWDMISRNTQSITTGIYYWTVTDRDGNTQIGKFVVMK